MDTQILDNLRTAYKLAVERWVAAIRVQKDLATPEHTVHAIDVWEHAGFSEADAPNEAREVRRVYEDALREVNFNF